MASTEFATTLVSNISTNHTETCDLYLHRNSAKVGLPLYYSLVFIIGGFANGLALIAIYQNRKKINSTTLYSINLVISDLLFATALPTRILYYALGFNWPLGEAFCRITSFFFYINTYAGVNFMTCLSVDRFFAVVHPFRYNKLRRARNAKYICLFGWFIVLMQTGPLLLQDMSKDVGGHVTCMEYPNFETMPHLPFLLLGACFIGYICPLVIILFCYVRISNKLCQAAKNNPLTEKSGSNKKAINTIILVIVVFLICFTPYHAAIIQHMIKKLVYEPTCSQQQNFQIAIHTTVCLMNMNSCLDPLVYFFACKGYKHRVMKLLKRQVSISLSSAARPTPDESSRDVVETHMTMLSSNGSRKY